MKNSLLIVFFAAFMGFVFSPGTGTFALGVPSAFAGNDKVTICHSPPGNPENPQTIEVAESAVAAHLSEHGDTLGACPDENENDNSSDCECPPGVDCNDNESNSNESNSNDSNSNDSNSNDSNSNESNSNESNSNESNSNESNSNSNDDCEEPAASLPKSQQRNLLGK